MTTIADELSALADPSYQAFQSKLVPNIDSARVLGVRTPARSLQARRVHRPP